MRYNNAADALDWWRSWFSLKPSYNSTPNSPGGQTSENFANLVEWKATQYPQRQNIVMQDWAHRFNSTVRSINEDVFDLIMQENLVVQGVPGMPLTGPATACASIVLMSLMAVRQG